MRSQRTFLAVLGALVLPCALFAGQATKKYDLKPGVLTVQTDLQVDDVRVDLVAITAENTSGTGPLRKSGAEAKVRMDNNGTKDLEAGAAVVVMDAQGNVLGAGSCGTKVLWMKPGERSNCSIDFGYVFRNLQNAKSVVVTLETRDRPVAK